MFNRDNYNVPNPFGQRSDQAGRPPHREGYINPNQQYQGRSVDQQAGQRRSDGFGRPQPPQQHHQHRGREQMWSLRLAKSPSNIYTFGNLSAVSPADFQIPPGGEDIYLLLNNTFVVSARPAEHFPPGHISFSEPQRSWMQIALTESVQAQIYDPFGEGDHRYLGSLSLEVGFAGKKSTDTPYDQDQLADYFITLYQNQIFAPGQKILMDHRSTPMKFTVKSVQLIDLRAEKPESAENQPSSSPQSRGILTNQTIITFFKDASSPINLKPSSRRAAANSIIQPDFKFEKMGIGGLDNEFAVIFRRAFASRVFPPGLIDKLGIQHVKGILLFGPPGTGKTLIARQIGKMLNAREPKVINGPEVLNKYVGASEENIRKLFGDAEKEYKEKGDESGLHIIIFDELDAVCKQRGSGAGGGTGVGDSVVNQLLSKLDGVNQLNNILLIGMTNRKDMIDDALLRPGRLELHVEISLPDETGRVQIFKIHTAKMQTNNILDQDVNLEELAYRSKNFSGAEIAGLVKSATSFAFQRHTKVGTVAEVSPDVENMKINREDFLHALDEVKPAFGVSEDELGDCIQYGIIDFSRSTQSALDEGREVVDQVRSGKSSNPTSLLLHGPLGSGKTALAAKIALTSGFPFIRLISPESMVSLNEMQKVQYIDKIFSDAYKSNLSIVVIDNIERIIDWVPIGPRFSTVVLSSLMSLLRKKPPPGRRLLIIGTTNKRSALSQLDVSELFDADIAIPAVNNLGELGQIMRKTEILDPRDSSRALDEVKRITGTDSLGIGIRLIFNALGKASVSQEDQAERFAFDIAKMVGSER